MPNQRDVVEALRGLGFRASQDAVDALLAHATKSRLAPMQLVEQLVALERGERDRRNLARRTRSATLGAVKPLDGFDWSFPKRIDRTLYEKLSTLEFVAEKQNVLLRGPSGVGKTMLAQNLAHLALLHGHTVRFGTLASVLADLLKQESLPAFERRLRRYTAPDLLILDEIGYLPCDAKAADMLYNVISRRHEQRSTVFTTNLAFKQWGAIFQGAACVTALVDRFTQHCHVLDIDADSYRQRSRL